MQYDKNLFNKFRAIDNALKKNEVDNEILGLIEQRAYEEYFFDAVSSEIWFDSLNKKGYFNPKNNPSPILAGENGGYKIPEWIVLQYLEKISKNTRELDGQLLKIIKDTSLYKNKKGNHIDNYRTWWFFVKILLNIPLSKVPYGMFRNIMPVWLTSMFDLTLPGSDLVNHLLPSYLRQIQNEKDVRKVEKLINLLLDIKEIKLKKSMLGKTFEVQTKIDNYWLKESLIDKNNAILIAQKCTNVPIFNLANTIKKIFNKKYKRYDYSSIWLRDLTQEQNKLLHDGEYFLAVILRKLVLEKSKFNDKEGGKIIEEFLSSKYPHDLFKRLGILLISEKWNSYGRYFYQILGDKKAHYFERDAFIPELAHLLIENAQKLTKKQKTMISMIIEKGVNKDLPDRRRKEYEIHWKQSWYKTLDSLPEFRKRYEDLRKITNKDIKIRKYEDIEETREIGFDKSPVSAEEFLKKTNEEIIKYVQEYKSTGEFPNFSPEGLYGTLQSSVELNPTKFAKNLEPFKIQNYHMLSSLYNGLEEAWKQKKDLPWANIIKFTLELLQEKWFWKPTDKDKNYHYNYFDWTLSAIGDLIQEGCKTDEWAFPEELHKDIEKIITLLINNNNLYEKNSYSGDGVTHALNSSRGKAITALIYLALREARLSDKRGEKRESKWSKVLRNNLERALDKSIYEAYTLLGQYLPNLHYIDKEWTETKTKNMHLVRDGKLFEAFMEGYLFSGKVYEKLYELLGDSYKRALSINFEEKRIQERLIQHIAVGYLRGNEELETKSLLDKLIKMNNQEYTREIIEFLWHQRDYIMGESITDKRIEKEKDDFKKRIFIFWDYIVSIFNKKKKLNEKDKKVLSELSKFAAYLPEINKKSFERLLLSASYVTYDFDSPYFIEYLNKLKNNGNKNQSAKFVATLFLVMLKGAKDLIPDYKWENVEEIISYLYQIGKTSIEVKDLANQICTFYAEHRNLRLRKIYETNNNL